MQYKLSLSQKILVSGAIAALLTLALGSQVEKIVAGVLYYNNTSVIGKTATTSTSYIIGGNATTTDSFVSDGYEKVSYMLSLASSTTPPTVCWTVQSSNDNSFWYAKDMDQNYASTTSHTSNGQQDCYTYSTSTQDNTLVRQTGGALGTEIYTFKQIEIGSLNTVYTRVKFYVLSGVSARLGVERNLKNEVILTK